MVSLAVAVTTKMTMVTLNRETDTLPDAGLVTQTATKYGSLVAVPVFARVYLASGNGSVVTTFVQSSSVPQ